MLQRAKEIYGAKLKPGLNLNGRQVDNTRTDLNGVEHKRVGRDIASQILKRSKDHHNGTNFYDDPDI